VRGRRAYVAALTTAALQSPVCVWLWQKLACNSILCTDLGATLQELALNVVVMSALAIVIAIVARIWPVIS